MKEPSKLKYLEELKFISEASKNKSFMDKTMLEFIRYLNSHMKLKFYKDGGTLAPITRYADDFDLDEIIFVIENLNKPWLHPKIEDNAYFQKIFDDYAKTEIDIRFVIHRLKQEFANIVNNQFYSRDLIIDYYSSIKKKS